MEAESVRQMRRLKDIIGDRVRPFVYTSLLRLIIQIMVLSFPYFVGEIAYAYAHGAVAAVVWWAAGLAGMFAACEASNKWHWCLCYEYISTPLCRDAERVALERLSKQPLSRVDDPKVHDVIENGRKAIDVGAALVWNTCVMTVFTLVLTIVGLSIIKWYAGLFALASFALYTYISYRINRGLLKDVESYTRVENRLASSFKERLRNMDLVICSGQEDREIASYAKEHRLASVGGLKLWKGYQVRMAVNRDSVLFICFFVLAATLIRLVFDDALSPEKFIVAIWWSSAAFMAMASTTGIQRDLMELWGRICAFMDAIEIVSVKDYEGKTSIDAFEGIRFDDVGFSYDTEPFEDRPVLKDVSFEIGRGEFVAIVGKSGSFKSTVLDLIHGSLEAKEGRVTVNGIDMLDLNRRRWWNMIGRVSQGLKLKLWDRSMVENVLYGRTWTSHERFRNVMKAAKLEAFYQGGENARMLDPIGENGNKLSGGERQRVAIARALIGDPAVLMFDEATTGLDRQTEAKLRQTIFDLAKVKGEDGERKYTIIAVTHDMDLARNADKIILLHKGKLIQIGSHTDLMAKSPLYRLLSAEDATGYDAEGADPPENASMAKGPVVA